MATWFIEGESSVKGHFSDLYEMILHKQLSDTLRSLFKQSKELLPCFVQKC